MAFALGLGQCCRPETNANEPDRARKRKASDSPYGGPAGEPRRLQRDERISIVIEGGTTGTWVVSQTTFEPLGILGCCLYWRRFGTSCHPEIPSGSHLIARVRASPLLSPSSQWVRRTDVWLWRVALSLSMPMHRRISKRHCNDEEPPVGRGNRDRHLEEATSRAYQECHDRADEDFHVKRPRLYSL